MKSEEIRKELQKLLSDFERELKSDDLRNKVLSLIPCFTHLRKLGKSLIPPAIAKSARDRILHYFLKYPGLIISGDELLVVSVKWAYICWKRIAKALNMTAVFPTRLKERFFAATSTGARSAPGPTTSGTDPIPVI